MTDGSVNTEISGSIAVVTFQHEKANSLPSTVLTSLAEEIRRAGADSSVRVIVLKSAGEKTFSAGASFDEFQRLKTREESREFFMGFARVILAMKAAPKFVLVRVQGKTVGGGVGLAAAGDYTFASAAASFRLSEFELGIGPFTIGPAVARRIGSSRFAAASVDTEWRSADWALNAGLYDALFPTLQELDAAVDRTAAALAARSPAATAALKKVFWEGTENWDKLLAERAEISGALLLSR